MTITAGIVLFAVIWFLCLFVALPIRIVTQDEAGKIEPGTPGSAPVDPMLRTKMLWVTLATVVIWSAIASVILFSPLTIEDIDIWRR